MDISVIIPTRNRAALLERCLLSLQSQTLAPHRFEVLIADNASTDRTPEVCERFSRRFSNFVYLRTERPGLHVGRHAGLKASSAPILLYGDDDIEAEPDWLEATLSAFEDESAALATGPSRPRYETPPPAWVDHLKQGCDGGWWLGAYSLLDLDDRERNIPNDLVFGCNYGIRRRVLEKVRGFHPDGMPKELVRFRGDGETAVSAAAGTLGMKAVYHPQAVVRHFVSSSRMTLEYIQWRGFIQGISDSYTRIRKHGGLRLRDQFRAHLRWGQAHLAKIHCARAKVGVLAHRHRNVGYWRGYGYHQTQVAKDPRLLDWVLRTDYLDEAT